MIDKTLFCYDNADYINMRDHIPRKPGYYWAEGHWNIQGAEVVSKALQEHLTKTVLK